MYLKLSVILYTLKIATKKTVSRVQVRGLNVKKLFSTSSQQIKLH